MEEEERENSGRSSSSETLYCSSEEEEVFCDPTNRWRHEKEGEFSSEASEALEALRRLERALAAEGEGGGVSSSDRMEKKNKVMRGWGFKVR